MIEGRTSRSPDVPLLVKAAHAVGVLAAAPLFMAGAVYAQDAASANAADTPVPAMACTVPVLPPRVEPSQDQIDHYNRQLPAYKQCVQDYIAQRQQAIQLYNALAKKNADAAEKAVQDFNQFNAQAKLRVQDNN